MSETPAVTLSILRESEIELVLGYELEGEIEALATAEAGRLELYRREA